MGKIMITDIHGMIIGLVVDSVNEVLRIPAHIVEPPPALSMNTDTKYIKGIAKMQDRLIILIQLEKLFDLAELSSINSTAATQA
jgi:purine-binding chemotaxis protein CheW